MIPSGEITEIVGDLSSGRTSLFMTCVREVTRRGAVVALVDTDETFAPEDAARTGVDLRRLLWVRCGGRRDIALRAVDLLVRCQGFGLVGLDLGERPPRIPLSLAFRLRLTVRRLGTTLLILASRRITGPGAALALRTVRRTLRWSGPGPVPTRLTGVGTAIEVLRRRGGLAPAVLSLGGLERDAGCPSREGEGSTIIWWAA
jgi:recA bacterial DNA recombination protein